MRTETVYTFPNLPRVTGNYKAHCPTCGKVITVRVSRVKDGYVTRWAYRFAMCRKCTTIQSGLLV